MAIVDLDTAKEHLRVTDNDSDSLIRLYLEQASAIVINYLKLPPGSYDVDAGLSDVGVSDFQESGQGIAPPEIESAVLLVLGALFRDREGATNPLSDAVKDILHRLRDPALA